MNYASKAQIQKIHVLLNRFGWIDEKKTIIDQVTEGRTESSRELSFEEAKDLLRQLSEYDPTERIKSLIFSLAYRANIIYGGDGIDKKINAAKLNLFLKDRGAVKKELNEMDYPELLKVHRQFEAVVKSVTASRNNKEAANAVRHLLGELNINTLTV